VVNADFVHLSFICAVLPLGIPSCHDNITIYLSPITSQDLQQYKLCLFSVHLSLRSSGLAVFFQRTLLKIFPSLLRRKGPYVEVAMNAIMLPPRFFS
jgi:hypothetical protein